MNVPLDLSTVFLQLCFDLLFQNVYDLRHGRNQRAIHISWIVFDWIDFHLAYIFPLLLLARHFYRGQQCMPNAPSRVHD